MLESTVNDLQLRSGPSLDSIGFVFPCNPVGGCTERVQIDAGMKAVAFAGPVAADGFDWYLVQLADPVIGSAHLGWAATPQDGDAWLIPAQHECPVAPTLRQVVELTPALSLYCYGGEQLTFDGFVVTGFGCNVTGTFEPEWLAHPCANMSFISPAPGSDENLFVHYPAPGVLNPTLELDDGQGVRITGHFDDPAAAGCVIVDDIEAEVHLASRLNAGDDAADEATCRKRFVVTGVEATP